MIYVDGIALVTYELEALDDVRRGRHRQTFGNQKPDFIRPSLSTVQLTLAGNDTQGLRYAPILAPEKYWLKWKLPKDVPAAVREQIETECAVGQQARPRDRAEMLDEGRLGCSSLSTPSPSSTRACARYAGPTSTSECSRRS